LKTIEKKYGAEEKVVFFDTPEGGQRVEKKTSR